MRFCLIGAGIIAESHCRAIAADSRAELAAIADIAPEKAQALAEKYGGAVFTDYREMIETVKPDAAIILLPHGLHLESVLFCAGKGLHILVEKPMAMSVAECDTMAEAAAAAKVRLMVAHIGRYDAANIAAREIVESGQLGSLITVTDIRNSHYFTANRPAWFLRKASAGGGVFMNHGAHSLHKLMYIAGSGIREATGRPTIKDGTDIEGAAQALVTLENGVTATICCSGYSGPASNETMLYFTGGTVRLHSGRGLWVSDGGDFEPRALPSAEEYNSFSAQLDDFINCILTGAQPGVPAECGRAVVAALVDILGG